MRSRALLDEDSATALRHLEAYVNGEEPLLPIVIRRYIADIQIGQVEVAGAGDILESPVMTSFVPLLLRILNSELYADVYAELLMAMLEQLPFGDALKFFPSEAVVEALKSPAYAVVYMAIHVIKVNLERGDADVAGFLHETRALHVIIERVLSTKEIPVNVASDTEEAFNKYVKLDVFDIADWGLFEDIHRSPVLKDALLLSRYMELMKALSSSNVPPEKYGPLAVFDLSEILADNDVFTQSILIAFYVVTVQRVPFHVYEGPITQCFEFLGRQVDESYVGSLLYSGLEELFIALTNATPEARQFAKRQLQTYPDCVMFKHGLRHDPDLFCRVDLDVIPEKEQFFAENYAHLSLKEINHGKFRCLLHLVDNIDFYRLLRESGIISDESLNTFSLPRVYEILNRLSEYDYSAPFLLEALPHAVLTHLMANDPSLVNPEIWESKQLTLYNLLLCRKVDLGVWEQGFRACYLEMVNGRNLKNVEPQVDLLDMTGQ